MPRGKIQVGKPKSKNNNGWLSERTFSLKTTEPNLSDKRLRNVIANF